MELEKSIAKHRCKLEKKYATGPGGTVPYIYAYQDGSCLTLTPFMLCEWAIALVFIPLFPFLPLLIML
jgi:hypothetical protein